MHQTRTARGCPERCGLVLDAGERRLLAVLRKQTGARCGHQQHSIDPFLLSERPTGVQPQRDGEGVRDDDAFAVAELGELGPYESGPHVERGSVGIRPLRVERLLALAAQRLGQLPLPVADRAPVLNRAGSEMGG